STQSAALAPPSASALPTHLTPFFGREAEIAQLIALLDRKEVRLITLLGLGGIGKTRLAQQIGHLQQSTDGDYVFFISLVGLIDGSSLASVLASTLELTGQGMEPVQALIQFLHAKKVLLLLDNFEHLLDQALLITQLLEAAPSLKILVTSRARLNLAGEQLFVVNGLPYAQAASDSTARFAEQVDDHHHDDIHYGDIVQASPALQLFSQCAQRVAPYFQLTAATIPAVWRICHLVQGMPLALEMAAAWLETLPLAAIADEIRHSIDFLATQRRDAPTHQQSIRAVFNRSWQLLAPSEQLTLRRCALFRGGFTRDAAAAVGDITVHALARLIHKSFVQFDQQHMGGRYQLHELLRQFAVEQLEVAGEMESIASAHSTYYLNLLAAQENRLVGKDSSTAVADIQQELANIHQGWNWAVAHVELASLRKNAYTLGEYYSVAGLSGQGVQTFENAYHTLGAAPVAPVHEDDRRWLLATFLALKADFLVTQNRLDEALCAIEEGYPLCQSTPNYWAETSFQFHHSRIFWRRGRQEEAEKCLQATLQLVQRYAPEDRSDHPLANVELSTLIWLAHPAAVRGDYQQADKYYADGLALARRIGNRRVEFIFLLNMAGMAAMRCDWEQARQLYTTILPLASDIRSQWGEASILLEFGIAICHEGEYEAALDMCQRALIIFQRTNEQVKTPLTLLTCAHIHGHLGEWEEVKRILELLPAPLQHDDHIVSNYARQVHATLAWLQGDFALGAAYANAGLKTPGNRNDLLHRAHFLILLGHNQSSRGLDSAAQLAYAEALALYSTLALPTLAAEAQAGLAELALRLGKLATALDYVEQVLTIIQKEPYAGYDEPFFLYLIAYRVLHAVQDDRASAILEQGYRLLHHYAAQIQDEQRRCAFLENVPSHYALHTAAVEARERFTLRGNH
ncbi:MAG: NACHT domain-containing protein, partial [Caldilineaceae bacterium]|nr:NACHT domain-containing protein [Caldilineaceae bacterium]